MRRFLRRIADGGNQAVFNNLLSVPWSVLLDSRNIVPVADGADIPLWPDSSGNGRDANPVPGFNPKYRTASSPKGLPLADFGPGLTGRQMFGTLPAGGVGSAAGFSFYAWYTIDDLQSTGNGDGQRILSVQIGSGFSLDGANFTALGNMQPAFNTSTTIKGSQAQTGNFVLSAICNPPSGGTGVANLYLNGTLIGTGNWNCNPNTTYLVSGNAGQNVTLHGKLGFAGFGPRADSDATRKNIEGYLRRIWG